MTMTLDPQQRRRAMKNVSANDERGPVLAYYGKTLHTSYPLLLIVGREYNGSGSVTGEMGEYNFTESWGSSFWNRAYSFASRCHSRTTRLKKDCVQSGCSPIVFSNALPLRIPNHRSAKEKRAQRLKVPQDAIERYIRLLFHQPLIPRVRGAVLSGLDDPEVFDSAVALIQSECEGRQIRVIRLPYFAARYSDEIFDEKLAEQDRAVVQEIIKAFYRSCFEKGA